MNNSFDQVFQAALALSEADRVELVDALIATFEPEDAAPLDDAWLAEIAKRSNQYDNGQVEPIPWAEVKEKARQRHRAH